MKDSDIIKTIEEIMQAISDLTGSIPLLFKEPSGGTGLAGLPLDKFTHCNDFCEKIKSYPDLYSKCQENDRTYNLMHLEKLQNPYWNTCHAGACELIVPLYDNGIYIGALYFGPFRKRYGKCQYKHAQKEFKKLPVYDIAKIKPIEVLLRVIGNYVINFKTRIKLQEISQDSYSEKIQKAIHYISTNYYKSPRASDTAAICNLSTSRFIHLFKEECGINFTEYLMKIKIEAAKQLIINTNLNMTEITYKTGFNNQSYFGSVFLKRTGFTPSEYRKKNKSTCNSCLET